MTMIRNLVIPALNVMNALMSNASELTRYFRSMGLHREKRDPHKRQKGAAGIRSISGTIPGRFAYQMTAMPRTARHPELAGRARRQRHRARRNVHR